MILRAAMLGLAAVCLVATACTEEPLDPAPSRPEADSVFPDDDGVIYVGISTDQPGLSVLEPGSNARSGFEVDLYRWLGVNTEPPFTPVEVDLTIADRIAALQQGRVQLVIEAFSITDERRRTVAFAGPYLITQQGLLVRAGESRIQVVNDLSGKTVCSLAGSTSLEQLNRQLGGTIFVTVETGIRQCVDRLVAGQVDAVSTDQLVLSGLASVNPQVVVIPSVTFC